VTDSSEGSGKLSLLDTVAMAVGGMVGGGIFAVLGQAATTAGNGAFLSFALAGALALVTGLSYARLTVAYDEPGGSFSYVEELVGPNAAGAVSWFLLVGYLFTNGLYAYTFGAYLGRLLGQDASWTPYLGSAIVLALGGLNVMGVQASAWVEDTIVYGKLTLLLVVTVVGATTVRAEEALPILQDSGLSIVGAAALIFVAYEGFQLLTYDYDEIDDHERNLPRTIWIAIPAVTLLYVAITFVLTGTVDAATIAAQEETVLADVAEPVLGHAGLVLVLVAAVMSTSSAINATLFSTGRLAKRVAQDHQLPAVLTRWTVNGVPVRFLGLQVGLGILLLFTADLEQIVTFSSMVFLLVFGVVNGAAMWHHVFEGWKAALPVAGVLGCLSAAVTLGVQTGMQRMESLVAIGVIAGILIVLRVGFQWLGHAGSQGS
jgi:hypothetical protein